jgi:hypothetical protein
MCERGDHPDGAMPTHSQITNVVEKDHSGYAGIVDRIAQQSSDYGVGATRLVHDSAAKVVVLSSQALDALRKGVVTEIGAAADNDTRRFTASV